MGRRLRNALITQLPFVLLTASPIQFSILQQTSGKVYVNGVGLHVVDGVSHKVLAVLPNVTGTLRPDETLDRLVVVDVTANVLGNPISVVDMRQALPSPRSGHRVGLENERYCVTGVPSAKHE